MAKVTIDQWVRQTQTRIDAVVKRSAQDVIEVAQKSRFKGGQMPIRFGFLINSGSAAIGRMPSGAGKPPEGYTNPSWNSAPAFLAINRMQPGEVLYFGWTARYSRAMEQKYGFMRLAAQQWQDIVNKNARKLRSMSRGN